MATPTKSEIARRLPCYGDWKHCIKNWALRSSSISFIRLRAPIDISKKIVHNFFVKAINFVMVLESLNGIGV